jgi:hypothetical protein
MKAATISNGNYRLLVSMTKSDAERVISFGTKHRVIRSLQKNKPSERKMSLLEDSKNSLNMETKYSSETSVDF